MLEEIRSTENYGNPVIPGIDYPSLYVNKRWKFLKDEQFARMV